MCRLSWNLGASTSWNPQGLSRPVVGLLYLYLYLSLITTWPMKYLSSRVKSIEWQYFHSHIKSNFTLNPLNAELNPTCHLLALLGPHPILHISKIRVNVTSLLAGRWTENYRRLYFGGRGWGWGGGGEARHLSEAVCFLRCCSLNLNLGQLKTVWKW